MRITVKQREYLIFGVALIVVGAIGFASGVAWKAPPGSAGDGGRGAGQFSRTGDRATGARTFQDAGGFASGEVIAKDDTTLTVKLPSGGTRIVFYTGATPFLVSATGSPADVKIGENVLVSGSQNPDGSVSAQSIQVRPIMPRRGDRGL
jgi:hypothetical protein